MRWVKKIIRAILNLLPVLSIFFIVNGDSSALQHNYKSLFVSSIPTPVINSGRVDLSQGEPTSTISNSLYVDFAEGNYLDFAHFNLYSSINNISTISLNNNNECSLGLQFGRYNFYSGLFSDSDYSSLTISSLPLFATSYNFPANSVNKCYQSTYYDSNSIKYDSNADFRIDKNLDEWIAPDYIEGTQAKDWFTQNIYPFPYSSNVLALSDTSVSTSDGFTYSGSFSFSRLWTGPIVNKFRTLSIPLFDESGYFLNKDNLYSGRQFEWKFYFKFDSSFSWNSDLSNGYIKLIASGGYSGHNYESNVLSSDCTANLITAGETQLEISCPLTLNRTYYYIIPSLVLYNDPYVWDSSNFEFYSAYLVTDGDTTRGEDFNSHIQGKMWSSTNGIGGDGGCAAGDFGCQLNNLFSFSIPFDKTPLGGILGNFSDQSSCASIPIIAGMIHSNETQVCPWFNSSIRNIVTPVLSLFSVILCFNFIVKWLKSGSGNFLEDSGGN